jgi:hypothetical protein
VPDAASRSGGPGNSQPNEKSTQAADVVPTAVQSPMSTRVRRFTLRATPECNVAFLKVVQHATTTHGRSSRGFEAQEPGVWPPNSGLQQTPPSRSLGQRS